MKNHPFKFLSIVVLSAIVLYFVVVGYRSLTDPFTTTLTYRSSSTESLSLDGWIIRDEEAFSSDAVTLTHMRREGEKIGKGQTMAVAYTSSDALSIVEDIEAQELQLQQLEFALNTYLESDAALKLDSSISDRIFTLQRSISQGDYAAAADDISTLKATILKRNHGYSSEEEIQSAITEVKGKLTSLQDSLSGAQDINAPQAGIYSAVCDGYETVLTPEGLDKLTPSALNALKPVSGETGNVGKLIYSSSWYYAANLPAEQAGQLTVGKSYSLHFAKGFDPDIPVTVSSVSAEENGQQTVILMSNRYLAQTTQLRHQQAQLILADYSGLRVPANALRMDENGQGGVYCVVAMSVYFKPVTIVYRGDDYTLVEPADGASGSSLLRPGDEVVITAAKLQEGQIISS